MTTVPYRRRNRHRLLSIVGAGLLVLLTLSGFVAMLSPAVGGEVQAATGLAQSSDIPVADGFDFPVENHYVTFDFLAPSSEFKNPDGSGMAHAGQDYIVKGVADSEGQPVYAVANGSVEYARNVNYPGYVVIIKQILQNG